MKSLAKNSIYNIIYQTISLVFPLITSVYISRILLEDGVGKVAYAQNVASYFLSFAALGFPAYGIREIAKVRDNQIEKNKAFTEMLAISAVSTTLSTASYLLLIVSVASFRNELALYICSGLLIFFNLINIDWLYQGEEEYRYITGRNLVIKILSIIAMILFVRSKSDYCLYALISSLGSAGNNLFNILHAHKYVKLDLKNLHLKKHIKPLLILTLAGFFGNIYNKIDITMLGSMATEASVGYYSNAHKIILILVSCCQAISVVFLPRLSYYYKNDKKRLDSLVSKGIDVLLSISMPALMGVFLLAQNVIVLLYGNNFAPAGVTLAVFAPLIIIRPLGDLLCYQLLICSGNEEKRIPAYIAASILNIGLNACLIPRIGENGAAIASVITELFVNTIQLHYTIRIVKLKIDTTHILKTATATLIMSAGVLLVKALNVGQMFTIVISVFLGMLLYFSVLVLLKDTFATDAKNFVFQYLSKSSKK